MNVKEYSSIALVLVKQESGELDLKVSLFTQQFGKLIVKAKSGRKITSKLSGHLEPGNFVKARIIEKRGFQIVDAVKMSKSNIHPYRLYLIDKLLVEAEPDFRIWSLLQKRRIDWKKLIKFLGWEVKNAKCFLCNTSQVGYFEINLQEFICPSCKVNQTRYFSKKAEANFFEL